MKFFFSFLFLTFTSLNAFAIESNVTIECKLSTSQSAVVSKVLLFSAPDIIRVEYRNGASEDLKPVHVMNAGIFGTAHFPEDIVWNNGQVFTPTAAGPLYVRFGCFITPSVFFERCISQGSGEPASFAGVLMNLDGKKLKFFDENICSRSVSSSI